MALLSRINILTMDYSFQGQPYVQVASKNGINLDSMDYVFQARPFWGFKLCNISKVSGVIESSIKIISGIIKTNIDKISGVED